jgi:hypothetical protein
MQENLVLKAQLTVVFAHKGLSVLKVQVAVVHVLQVKIALILLLQQILMIVM